MTRLLLLLLLLALWPSAAAADPVSMTALLTGFQAFAGTMIGRFVIQTALSLGLSALARRLRPTPQPPGVRQQVEVGGDRTQRVMLGRCADAGHLVWAGSHGRAGKTPNAYAVHVVLLSVIPGVTLRRVSVNGAWCTLGPVGADGAQAVTEFRRNGVDHLWVRFYGSGRVSVPQELQNYYSRSDFPWAADMVGRDCAWAIITARFNPDVHRQMPAVVFECDGIPLYDRRKDSTAGGNGAQRANDRSTWAQSDNPIVAADTILGPGLGVGATHLWGPRLPNRARPVAAMIAAANACDALVPNFAGPQPAYRFGCIIDLAQEPREVASELIASCGGDIGVCEGRVAPVAGAPGGPVLHITDLDCSIDHPQELDPFRGIEATYNAATATFPDPASSWATTAAPERLSPEWEAEDGGRRQVAALRYPYVPFVRQVQSLMLSALRTGRRMRRHRITLRPRCMGLEPVVDTIAWTSARNGYQAKLFQVTAVADLPGGWSTVSLLEVDPDDYDWQAEFELPHDPPPAVLPILEGMALPGADAEPAVLTDVTGTARRSAIRILWDPDGLDGVTAVAWRARVIGRTEILAGSTPQVSDGYGVISEGIVPGQDYEVQLAPVATGIPAIWSAWIPVTAPPIGVSLADLDGWLAEQLAWLDGVAGGLQGALGEVEAQVQQTRTALEARIGDAEAAVETVQTSVASIEGRAAASYVLRARAGGAAGEVEVVAASDVTGAASQVRLTADRVLLDGMAQFTSGLRSNDFVEGATGFYIDAEGNAEFNQLVNRSWLVPGAVTDVIRLSRINPVRIEVPVNTILSYTIPETPDGVAHIVGCTCQVRVVEPSQQTVMVYLAADGSLLTDRELTRWSSRTYRSTRLPAGVFLGTGGAMTVGLGLFVEGSTADAYEGDMIQNVYMTITRSLV